MTRPFKGLKLSKGPETHYDAVVIGAGIGGLICANLLVRQKLRVLLVERHCMVGGYCSTFRRKGFVFDAASHFYPLLGNQETLTGKLLHELGVHTQWVKMDPVDHFHFPDGSYFPVPADYKIYREKLAEEFPHERKNLDAFFKEVRRAYLAGLLRYFKGVERDDAWKGVSVKDVLDHYFQDRKLKLLLTADGPHWGSPPCKTSFVFDSMLRLSYFLGNYYPKGGSQVFADDLAARFEQQGGHILMKSEVTSIHVSRGSARGIEVLSGPVQRRVSYTVNADVVVSNGDMLHTLDTLIGREHLDPSYMAFVEGLRPSCPCFLTHIGVKGYPTEALSKAQGYYWNEWDPDLLGRGGLKFKMFVPTLFEPKMAPPGSHVVIMQKVVEIDYNRITDWAAHKAGIENYILTELEKVVPGFHEAMVVHSSASAQTSFRFTNNHQGAMLGWEMSPDQLGQDRPDFASPLDGLFFTGHWTRPGGGITPVIISAMRVAELVTNRKLMPVNAA